MKKKLLLITLFVCILQTVAFGNIISNDNERATETVEEIKLAAILETGSLKSIFIPYRAALSGYTLDITYLKDLYDINIEIVNQSGEIFYNIAVNPMKGNHFFIDLSDFPEGFYTLNFRNSNGVIISGYFDLY